MGDDVRCEWKVRSCSSEAEVHEASNALKSELYRVWQTTHPTDEAWLTLEAHPPSAFSELQIVNAGSALVEVFGLPEDCAYQYDDDNDDDYIMLLSAQQLMSTKDVINKANRNRSFTYTCSDKLSQRAMQHRWKQIKILCRQPFGSEEHKTCIGLSVLNFRTCKTLAEMAADSAEASLQQNMKAGLAKLFPKGSSSAEREVVSQVTEPSRPMETHKVKKDLGANVASCGAENCNGKRKLPSWQFPSEKVEKGCRDGYSGHGAVSSEDAEENSKASKRRKATSQIERPEMKGPATSSEKRSPQRSTPGKDEKGPATSSEKRSPQRSTPGKDEKGSATPIEKRTTLGKQEKEPGTSSRKRTMSSKQQKNSTAQGQDISGSRSNHEVSSLQFSGTPLPQVTKGHEGQPGPNQHAKGASSEIRHSKSRTIQSTSNPGEQQVSQSRRVSASPQSLDQPESSRKGKYSLSDVNVGKKVETQAKSLTSNDNKGSVQSSPKVHETKQANSKTLPFSKFLDGVIFVISGLVNPERADLRDKALQMGGQYRPDWNADCTLLVCAFADTPKFNQVKMDNGTIVSKAWIEECYQRKELVDIEKYLMHAGKPWRQVEASKTEEPEEPEDECPTVNSRQSMKALASLQEVEKWVHEDVASSITWLRQQEVQPEAEELQSIAVQGIQVCLDDTIACLRNKQSIKKIIDSWDYVPRAVQELASREDQAQKARKQNFWSDMLSEAERLKWIYSKELEKVTLTDKQHVKQTSMNGEDNDTEDDATDVIPDDASSEDTEVLDEDDIREAKEALSKIILGLT